jgi:hypothetical protein
LLAEEEADESFPITAIKRVFSAWIRIIVKSWIRIRINIKDEWGGDSKSINERGPSLVGSLGLPVGPVQEIFLSAQYKICFSSPYTFSGPLSSSPSKLGRQLC